MNLPRLMSAILIAVWMIIGVGCSGDQPTSNAKPTNNTPASVNNAATDANAGSESGRYPDSVAEEFVKSCERSGSSRAFCSCVFEKVQERYTFEEFSVIESKIIAGQTPEDFVEFSGKARAACTK